jgi:hypothetical protein
MKSFIGTHQEKWITSRDVMIALPDISHQAASNTLERLAKAHRWEKSEDGNFRIVVNRSQHVPTREAGCQ